MRQDERGIHFRQSDVDSYRTCPEQWRQLAFGYTSDWETDAALVGTTLHHVIEHDAAATATTLKAMQQFAKDMFRSQVEGFDVEFRWSKFDGYEAVNTQLNRYCENWWNSKQRVEFLENRADMLLEWDFDVPLFTYTYNNGDTVPVWLTGTSDVVWPARNVVWDWKTAANMYKFAQWERQRWAIQPTVYCYAADQAGLIHGPEWMFFYKVFFQQDKPGTEVGPRTIGVSRNMRHVEWLKVVIGQMLEQLSADVTPFPMRDDHALCSSKWCSVFAAGKCKGAFFPDGNFE